MDQEALKDACGADQLCFGLLSSSVEISVIDTKISVDWFSSSYEFWSYRNKKECNIVTPWIKLQCFLESTLQVATIYDMVGDPEKVSYHLRIGKDISTSQDLKHFNLAFSTLLAKVLWKWCLDNSAKRDQLADSATEALLSAESLVNGGVGFFCTKCKLVFELNISQIRKINPLSATPIYEDAFAKLNSQLQQITKNSRENWERESVSNLIDEKWKAVFIRLHLSLFLDKDEADDQSDLSLSPSNSFRNVGLYVRFS